MAAAAAPYLKCPHCGTQNRSDQDTCYACGTRLHDGAAGDHARGSGEAGPTRGAVPVPVPADAAPSSRLHAFGWTLVATGAIGLVVALFMETSVESDAAFLDIGPDRIHNIGLLARQMILSIASAATLVTGAVFVAAGYLSDLRAIARNR